jgi:hypothetical protein
VNDVGEPCAGEPHARFDGRELETEHPGHGHRGEHSRPGNRRKKGPEPYRQERHRASSRPYILILLGTGWSRSMWRDVPLSTLVMVLTGKASARFPELRQAMTHMKRVAIQHRNNYIGTEHLL